MAAIAEQSCHCSVGRQLQWNLFTHRGLSPAGGAYNFEPTVQIKGKFQDYRAPRCRFGALAFDNGIEHREGWSNTYSF